MNYEDMANLFGYKEYNGDLDEKEYALAILMLLEQFYRKYSTKSMSYVKNHFNEDLKQLEEKVLKKNEMYWDKYEQSKIKEQLLIHEVPSSKHNKVDLKYDIHKTKDIVIQTIKDTFNTLQNDVSLKIKVFEDRNDDVKTFDIVKKLTDCVKRVKRAIGYGTNTIHQKVSRSAMVWHYGENATYYWVCVDDNITCAWCREQSKQPPRKMEDWELDHPHGRCSFEPSNKEATDLYNQIVGVYE